MASSYIGPFVELMTAAIIFLALRHGGKMKR